MSCMKVISRKIWMIQDENKGLPFSYSFVPPAMRFRKIKSTEEIEYNTDYMNTEEILATLLDAISKESKWNVKWDTYHNYTKYVKTTAWEPMM